VMWMILFAGSVPVSGVSAATALLQSFWKRQSGELP